MFLAGAGKSVLAYVSHSQLPLILTSYSASVIENLKSTLSNGEILIFFYCDFRIDRSTYAAEVLRSLLSQLLQHSHHYTIELKDLIDDLVKEGQGGAPVISDVMLLARHVARASQQFSQQPFLVIDALDECKDIEEFLDAVVELTNGGIRLFVTSRPLQVVKESLSGLPSISMDVMRFNVHADITLHVERELDSHRSHRRLRFMEHGLKDEICSALCNKADGM